MGFVRLPRSALTAWNVQKSHPAACGFLKLFQVSGGRSYSLLPSESLVALRYSVFQCGVRLATQNAVLALFSHLAAILLTTAERMVVVTVSLEPRHTGEAMR